MCSPGQPASRQRSAKSAKTPSLPLDGCSMKAGTGSAPPINTPSKCSLHEGINSPVPQAPLPSPFYKQGSQRLSKVE